MNYTDNTQEIFKFTDSNIYDEEFYNVIFNILKDHLKIHEIMRRDFLRAHMDKKYPVNEYRVSGILGFGCKYWRKSNYITYYLEDNTLSRDEIYNQTNLALNEYKSFYLNNLQKSGKLDTM